jgi:hypothetical protein
MSLNIQLVNMPFGNIEKPSIGLTQLSARTKKLYAEKVSVGLNYLNHEFGKLLGPQAYKYIASHQNGLVSGFGEWFFRQVAFPDEPDNREAYLTRFGPYFGPEVLHARERFGFLCFPDERSRRAHRAAVAPAEHAVDTMAGFAIP